MNTTVQSLMAEPPGTALPWLATLREAGRTRFTEMGLPTPRQESWKYTNLRALEQIDFGAAPPETVGIDRLPFLMPAGASEHRLVFVNGRYRADLSALDHLPEGAHLGGLAELLERRPDLIERHLGQIAEGEAQPWRALNDAMMADGLVLGLSRDARVATPIEVIYIAAADQAPLACHPRNLIVLEPGAHATLVEHHISLGETATLSNGVTEVHLKDGATLHHYKMQAEGQNAFHLNTLHARVERNAHYDTFEMSLGSQLSRNEIAVRLVGPGANCHVNGAYLMRGQQHCDTTTTIEHLAPHTSCREVFKGVLDDRARAVFQGRIVVHPGAQKADGHQLSKAMLLSDQAEIDAKPELEIYADDVKCSHGATAGELDKQALFYLRARGIPEARARSILVEAFLSETIDAISAEDLCPAFLASIADWLKTEQ